MALCPRVTTYPPLGKITVLEPGRTEVYFKSSSRMQRTDQVNRFRLPLSSNGKENASILSKQSSCTQIAQQVVTLHHGQGFRFNHHQSHRSSPSMTMYASLLSSRAPSRSRSSLPRGPNLVPPTWHSPFNTEPTDSMHGNLSEPLLESRLVKSLLQLPQLRARLFLRR